MFMLFTYVLCVAVFLTVPVAFFFGLKTIKLI
nr:cytochrome b6-f complex subunit VI [Porphyridium aerugineum]UNJ17979.1 cytochrome b6-f complex subunit VI [Porphyridium aerugineum]